MESSRIFPVLHLSNHSGILEGLDFFVSLGFFVFAFLLHLGFVFFLSPLRPPFWGCYYLHLSSSVSLLAIGELLLLIFIIIYSSGLVEGIGGRLALRQPFNCGTIPKGNNTIMYPISTIISSPFWYPFCELSTYILIPLCY